MNGKIILNLAISLDGFIATEEGGFDWIKGDGTTSCDTLEQYDFNAFLNTIDVVVMGRVSYNHGFAKDYSNKEVYVLTSEKLKSEGHITFINEDIVSIITKLKEQGKNIYLFGGGASIDAFIKADVIDEYIIAIIPVLLGKGKKLFYDNNPTIELSLQKYTISESTTVLHYVKRK